MDAVADLGRPARVLRVITRLNVGGPALHAAILATRLDPARFETLLVAGREGAREGAMLDLGRLPADLAVTRVTALGRSISPAHDARALFDVVRIARRYRPDIVHTHLSKAGLIGRIAGRISGAKAIIHTFHGTVFRGYFDRPGTMLYLQAERALARITDRIVAITPLQKKQLLELRIASEAKVVEIPLGLDLAAFAEAPDRDEARVALGLPTDVAVVLYVGRLVPIKDIPTLLRAIAALRTRATALIVGDGTERVAAEGLARELGITDRCFFLGWRSDLPTLYAAADVVALSSQNEGSPVSLIEALAAGSCVVATAVGGVPDVVVDERTGLLVSPGDADALALAMDRALEDPGLRERLGGSGRAAVLERFSAERLVRDVTRLYETLLLQSR